MNIDIVVTRHPGLADYLLSEGLIDEDTPVISHATPEDVRDKTVAGVLPMRLAAVANWLIEVPLHLPEELRGDELNEEQVREHSEELFAYRVLGYRIDELDLVE